jgi:hypothetical protein
MSIIPLKVSPLEGVAYNLNFPVVRMFNAAYAGRDIEDVQHHIDEMAALGVPAPTEFPQAIALSNHLLSTTDELQLYAETTGGEVEYVLFWHQDEILLGVGSDHCDIWLERHSMRHSKNVAPNIIASEVWRFADVASYFDQLELSCDIWANGEWCPSQRDSCASLLPPDFWFEKVEANFSKADGTVLFSGTIGSLKGVQKGDGYRIKLYDPNSDRALTHRYHCHLVDELNLEQK